MAFSLSASKKIVFNTFIVLIFAGTKFLKNGRSIFREHFRYVDPQSLIFIFHRTEQLQHVCYTLLYVQFIIIYYMFII